LLCSLWQVVRVNLTGPFAYKPKLSTEDCLDNAPFVPRPLRSAIESFEAASSEQGQMLAQLSAAAGGVVSFRWDPGHVYRALRFTRHRLNIAHCIVRRYLGGVAHALLRPDSNVEPKDDAARAAALLSPVAPGELTDDLLRPLLLRLWPTRQVSFSLVADDYHPDPDVLHLWCVDDEMHRASVEQEQRAAAAASGGSGAPRMPPGVHGHSTRELGVRFVDGELDVFCRAAAFDVNTGLLRTLRFQSALETLPEPDASQPKKKLSELLRERAQAAYKKAQDAATAETAQHSGAAGEPLKQYMHFFAWRPTDKQMQAVQATGRHLDSPVFTLQGERWFLRLNASHIQLHWKPRDSSAAPLGDVETQSSLAPRYAQWYSSNKNLSVSDPNVKLVFDRSHIADDMMSVLRVWVWIKSKDKPPFDYDSSTCVPQTPLLGSDKEASLLPLQVRREVERLRTAQKNTLRALNAAIELAQGGGVEAAAAASAAAGAGSASAAAAAGSDDKKKKKKKMKVKVGADGKKLRKLDKPLVSYDLSNLLDALVMLAPAEQLKDKHAEKAAAAKHLNDKTKPAAAASATDAKKADVTSVAAASKAKAAAKPAEDSDDSDGSDSEYEEVGDDEDESSDNDAEDKPANGSAQAGEEESGDEEEDSDAKRKPQRLLCFRGTCSPAQAALVELAIEQYLPALCTMLSRELKDPVCGPALLRHWNTLNIRFTLDPDDGKLPPKKPDPRIAFEAAAAASTESHNSVRCDACNQYPIRGARWCCNTCSNFDYCMKVQHLARCFHVRSPSLPALLVSFFRFAAARWSNDSS
jgi:hypothetical protein